MDANAFSGLTALQQLDLHDNALSSLPAGIFSGLTALTALNLYRQNDQVLVRLPVTVSLELVEAGQFKATAPTGGPFTLEFPVSVTNGTTVGGANSITIPVGGIESDPLTVSRTVGTLSAVTVDIGTLPALPSGHRGYTLIKSTDLPLEVIPRVVSITSSATHPTKDSFTVTITFSEAVTGLTAGEIAVTNGRGSNFAGTGASYTLDIAPNANIEANVTVQVPAGAAVDGMNIGNVEGIEIFAVDTQAPRVLSITSNATHPTKDPFTVTITFSEEVTGLAASEIVVSNGRGSNFAGMGASYTLDIAPNPQS